MAGSGRESFGQQESVSAVREYFGRLADGEWRRLDADLPGQVSRHVHQRFLERLVAPGMRVLEVGAGPGRFTLALADIRARVTVTDRRRSTVYRVVGLTCRLRSRRSVRVVVDSWIRSPG